MTNIKEDIFNTQISENSFQS